MMEEFKRKVDLAVEVIESCFDENNPNDNLSFDERLQRKINNCEDEVVRGILNDAKNFWFYFLILEIVRMFANKQICSYKSLKIRYIAKIFCMNTRFQGLGWQIKKCCINRMYKDIH